MDTNKFKERWEQTDTLCECCGQVTKQVRGITRQNIKRLFSIKMNFTEFLITFMLVMIIVLGYVYFQETKESRDWINNMYSGSEDNCKMNCNLKCEAYSKRIDALNLSLELNPYSQLNLTRQNGV